MIATCSPSGISTGCNGRKTPPSKTASILALIGLTLLLKSPDIVALLQCHMVRAWRYQLEMTLSSKLQELSSSSRHHQSNVFIGRNLRIDFANDLAVVNY